MNRSDMKEYFRTLAESTVKEQNKRSMLNESNSPDDDDFSIGRLEKPLSTVTADDEDPAYASQFGSHLDGDEFIEFQNAGEQYIDDLAMTSGPWYGEEDVEDMARYDALNDNVDATLYRDNPDYRRAFKEALLNPPSDKE